MVLRVKQEVGGDVMKFFLQHISDRLATMEATEVQRLLALCKNLLDTPGVFAPRAPPDPAKLQQYVSSIEFHNAKLTAQQALGEVRGGHISETEAGRIGDALTAAQAALGASPQSKLYRVIGKSGVAFRCTPDVNDRAQPVHGRPTPGLLFGDLVFVEPETMTEGQDGTPFVKICTGARTLWLPIMVGEQCVLSEALLDRVLIEGTLRMIMVDSPNIPWYRQPLWETAAAADEIKTLEVGQLLASSVVLAGEEGIRFYLDHAELLWLPRFGPAVPAKPLAQKKVPHDNNVRLYTLTDAGEKRGLQPYRTPSAVKKLDVLKPLQGTSLLVLASMTSKKKAKEMLLLASTMSWVPLCDKDGTPLLTLTEDLNMKTFNK